MRLSISGTVNNIKIICSIRFSLLITINRFYKLFLVEDAFVNRRPETIPPLFFIPTEPYPARFARHLPHAGKALFRKYRFPHPTSAPSGHLLPEEGGSCPREPLPLEGAAERSEAGLASFLGDARVLSLMTHLRRSPRSFSSRQNPIRLAPLATFPTRGRLCPSLFFFHICVYSF